VLHCPRIAAIKSVDFDPVPVGTGDADSGVSASRRIADYLAGACGLLQNVRRADEYIGCPERVPLPITDGSFER